MIESVRSFRERERKRQIFCFMNMLYFIYKKKIREKKNWTFFFFLIWWGSEMKTKQKRNRRGLWIVLCCVCVRVWIKRNYKSEYQTRSLETRAFGFWFGPFYSHANITALRLLKVAVTHRASLAWLRWIGSWLMARARLDLIIN